MKTTNMLARLVVCVLLVISTTQALPTSDQVPEGTRLFCDRKNVWYKNITAELKKMYDEHLKQFATLKINADDETRMKAQHDQFENTISNFTKKLDAIFEELRHIPDEKSRLDFCKKVVKELRLSTTNLTRLAVGLKIDVLSVLDHAKVPTDLRAISNKTLSEMVNLLFMADRSENLLKDVEHLVRICRKLTEHGIALEKEWTLTPDGKLETPPEDDVHYDEADLVVDKALEEEVNAGVAQLLDDTDIKIAEARAEERLKNEENDEGIFGLTTTSIFIAAFLVGSVSAIVVGVVKHVRKSRSVPYSGFT